MNCGCKKECSHAENQANKQEGVVNNSNSNEPSIPVKNKSNVPKVLKSKSAPIINNNFKEKGDQKPIKEKSKRISGDFNVKDAIAHLRGISTSNDVKVFVKNDKRVTIIKAASAKVKSLDLD